MAMEGEVSRLGAITKGTAVLAGSNSYQKTVDDYKNLFDEKKGGSVAVRQEKYMGMVNSFYNMVTDIYEFGWGQSFHFAPRHKAESFPTSIMRHEMYLAHRLGLEKGKVALDLGCGVGGPGRVMARFSGAHITGINNNDYQIERCKKLTLDQGPKDLCSYMKADFQHLPVDNNSQDVAFHVEALVHSPNKLETFQEVFRVLKPGGFFGGYDWVMTDKFDRNNENHQRIKKSIELGNSIPDLLQPWEIDDCIVKAGFELIEARDVGVWDASTDIPWFESLEGKYWSLTSFKHTPLGIWLTNKMIWCLETLRIAPRGTLEVHSMLSAVAVDLVEGGKQEIFTPMYFYLARKPISSKK